MIGVLLMIVSSVSRADKPAAGEANGRPESAARDEASGGAKADGANWAPAKGPLMTRWAKDVSPDNVHLEYPRPQMVRKEWQNLNGLWDYAIRPKDQPQPKEWDGQILVPFPVESALSGVMKSVGPDKRLWYRRTFEAPKEWGEKRVLLHFGAVDWETAVTVNGKEVGKHRGGYDPFTFEIAEALNRDAAEQEIIVSVYDPTDTSWQPRGKQVLKPGGIFYTPTTGIWQSVWLEPVPENFIRALRIEPKIDEALVRVEVDRAGDKSGNATITVLRGDRVVMRANRKKTSGAVPGSSQSFEIPLPLEKNDLWSPENPFLFKLLVSIAAEDGAIADEVESYFAMRKISLGKDDKGITRILLNNKFLFQYGPLDQGYWPDGLYTAPTDEALKYDIEITKKLGFNMIRKHVKVEPARWYYWADKLGVLVWQDMPSGDRSIGQADPDITREPESAKNFETEWSRIITALYNHPSIIMWVPFNEGWGQYDTARIVDFTRKLDPTRLVNNASGWTDRGVGDVIDWHVYPGPGSPKPEEKRAAVLGEFGGLGLPVEGHTWLDKGNWGYRSFTTAEELEDAYVNLLRRLHPLIGEPGLSAAVYTQTTDVEVEVNGLLTYDREVIKIEIDRVAAAAARLHEPPPRIVTPIADSRAEAQEWHYTTDAPADDWMKPDFDASAWKTAPGGFGTEGTPGAVVRTEWNTPDIWIRRSFELPQDLKLTEPALVLHHDEDAKVYINGVLALETTGYTTGYQHFPISKEAQAALKPGQNLLAIHCRQTGGGQYIDAGLTTDEHR